MNIFCLLEEREPIFCRFKSLWLKITSFEIGNSVTGKFNREYANYLRINQNCNVLQVSFPDFSTLAFLVRKMLYTIHYRSYYGNAIFYIKPNLTALSSKRAEHSLFYLKTFNNCSTSTKNNILTQ